MLGNVYWLPGLGNPAHGLTETKSDMGPLLRLLESGTYNPGALRPKQDVAPNEAIFFFLGTVA